MKTTPISQPPITPIAENKRGEQRHRDHAAPEARRDDAGDRIDGHHVHCLQLLGDFIRPISAVTDEPAREANSKPATTGPSSRVSDRATRIPSASVEP
jgi:hypothetical protein